MLGDDGIGTDLCAVTAAENFKNFRPCPVTVPVLYKLDEDLITLICAHKMFTVDGWIVTDGVIGNDLCPVRSEGHCTCGGILALFQNSCNTA